MKVRNTFIIFIVSGFWHGANWTFIVWGALNAIYFLPLLLTNNNRNNLDTVAQGKLLPSLKEISFMLLTFGLTVFAWIFFRAENIGHAISYISDIISPSILSMPYIIEAGTGVPILPKKILFLIGVFVFIEWLGREHQFAIQNLGIKWKRPIRYAMYYAIIIAIFWFGGKEQQFIYFQF